MRNVWLTGHTQRGDRGNRLCETHLNEQTDLRRFQGTECICLGDCRVGGSAPVASQAQSGRDLLLIHSKTLPFNTVFVLRSRTISGRTHDRNQQNVPYGKRVCLEMDQRG